MDLLTARFCWAAWMSSNPSTVGYKPFFKSRLQPTRFKQRLVNQRFSRRRRWGSLPLVESNFLGNPWVNLNRSTHLRQGCLRLGCHQSGALPDRVVAIEMAAGGDAQPRAGAAPALLMVSTHRAMRTTARCTEVAA